MTPVGATAIIVTHNSAPHISRAISALRDANLDVRVVDNASGDATAAIIERDFPEVTLLINAANIGFARAVNQALIGANAESILLINPDCVVPAQTVTTMLDFLADRPTVGIVGPRLVNRNGTSAVSAHPFESLTSVVLSRFGGNLVPIGVRRLFSGRLRKQSYDACAGNGEPLLVDWLSGACLAVRRDLLHRIGGLDESYFLYYEDEELCLQAREHGADVVYLPGVTAHHAGGASSTLGATWPHLYQSMLIFFARHRESTYQAVRLTVLLRAACGIVLGNARRLRPGSTGAVRAKAWLRVARIAIGATRRSILAQPGEGLPIPQEREGWAA